MKKPSTTTTLLTTLLIASLAGNAVQYTAAPKEQQPIDIGIAETDDPNNPGSPSTTPDKQALAWDTFATFAVTYQVDAKAGTPGGATVTIYYIDAEPTVIRSQEKPGLDDITWAPPLAGLPGVISIQPVAVVARGRKAEE